jgi:hypothetical protein
MLLGTDSFEHVTTAFDTAVHEGSHIWGWKGFDGRTHRLRVRRDLEIAVRRLDDFPRHEILEHHPHADADSYAATYLENESGKQGFNSVLDEFNAYVHGLAARYCTRDLLAPGTRVSARDGVLVFMFYVGEYLRIARASHPKDYAAILADPGHVEAIRTIWDRAEFWLRQSKDEGALGVKDELFAGLAYDTARLDEIVRVRSFQPQAKE